MTGGTDPTPTQPSTPASPRLEGAAHRPRHARSETDLGQPTGQAWPPPRAVDPLPEDEYDEVETGQRRELSNWAVSHLRTYVPIIWGMLVTAGLSRWPEAQTLMDVLHIDPGAAGTAVTALVTALWYTVWRYLEPHIPAVLVAIVLGHPQAPTYPTAGE